MSLAIEASYGPEPPQSFVPGQRLPLELVSDLDPISRSRRLFNESIRLREEVPLATRPEGVEIEKIRSVVGGWIEQEGILAETPDYRAYSRDVIDGKLGRLISFLRDNYAGVIPEIDLLASKAFIEASFAMYEATPGISGEPGATPDQGKDEPRVAADADGSFAFLVPVRTSRTRKDYSTEADDLCPVLRYVPDEYTGLMAVGLPPTIIAEYAMDKNGRRGHAVMAAVYGDMERDLSRTEALRVAQLNVNDAAVFAQRRLGSTILGLGATLPGFTRYGATIEGVLEENGLTTTGHGGTAYLMLETLKMALEQGVVVDKDGKKVTAETLQNLGFLGLGAIGAPAAAIIAGAFPQATMKIFDPRGLKKKHKTLREVAIDTANKRGESNPEQAAARIIAAKDEAEVIADSQVIMSTANGQFDLVGLGIESLAGKFIGDDSQPDSFSKEQVEGLGGVVAGIVGYDDGNNFGQSTAVRELYHFGMLQERQVFGCEAEVAALHRYYNELLDRGMGEALAHRIVRKLTVRAPVAVQGARYIGALFKKYHLGPARVTLPAAA